MKLRNGLISAVAGASLLGGAGIAALTVGGGATVVASPAAATTPAPAPSVAPPGGATSTPSTPAPDDASCKGVHDGGWPDFVSGEPAGFGPGDKAGVYVWHSDDGWHLRVTHAHDTHQVYTGVLTTPGTFHDVDAVRLEGNDHLSVGPNGHAIAFRFNNFGGVDGLDFRTDCAPRITFELKADGRELPTAAVYLGHAGTNPTSVPFTVERGY